MFFFVADFIYKTENNSLFSSFPCVDYEKKRSVGRAIDLRPIAGKRLIINHADTKQVLPPPRI